MATLADFWGDMYEFILEAEQAERDRLAGDPPRDPDDDDRVGCVELE